MRPSNGSRRRGLSCIRCIARMDLASSNGRQEPHFRHEPVPDLAIRALFAKTGTPSLCISLSQRATVSLSWRLAHVCHGHGGSSGRFVSTMLQIVMLTPLRDTLLRRFQPVASGRSRSGRRSGSSAKTSSASRPEGSPEPRSRAWLPGFAAPRSSGGGGRGGLPLRPQTAVTGSNSSEMCRVPSTCVCLIHRRQWSLRDLRRRPATFPAEAFHGSATIPSRGTARTALLRVPDMSDPRTLPP